MLDEQYRIPVSIDTIAPTMRAAAVAIEDRRFFDEPGVDPIGTARALVSDAAGGAVQGGSTITQQYVKNYLINVLDRDDPAAQRADRADNLARKVREAELATGLARSTSKNDVLAGYLNVVEFSGNVYGVEAAAHAYFGTTAAALTVPQAALLAGMVNNPNLYDPYDHPQQALTAATWSSPRWPRSGRSRPPRPPRRPPHRSASCPTGRPCRAAPAWRAAPGRRVLLPVRRRLPRAGRDHPDQLATGGYTIRTTMDPAASAAAKAAVDANVPTPRTASPTRSPLIRPGHDGHEVLAMVANRNYGTDAAQGERATNIVADPSNVFGAGSSFKIFTTAAALENGTVGLRHAAAEPGLGVLHPAEREPLHPLLPGRQRRDELPRPDQPAGRAGHVAERRVRRAGGPHGRADRGPHGAAARPARHPGEQRRRRHPRHRPGRPAVARTPSTTSRSRSTSRTSCRSPSATAR